MRKYAPLPWRLVAASAPEIEDASGRNVAECLIPSRSDDENLANAAFIVRACNAHDEMLEALEYIVAWNGDAWNAETARAKAVAAIAKANGVSPDGPCVSSVGSLLGTMRQLVEYVGECLSAGQIQPIQAAVICETVNEAIAAAEGRA